MRANGRDGGAIGWTGLACATAAVGLGVAYLAAAGAPGRMTGMNIAAYLVGLAAYATIAVPQWRVGALRAWLMPALGLVLLATALLAPPVEGAARWAVIGPLVLQVSLIVLPAMLLLFARHPDASGAAGLAIAALALALQPDRAMAGALAAGLAAQALVRGDRHTLGVSAIAIGAFAATLAQRDRLPAVPFVDGIFYTAFDVHPLAGAGLLLGAALLIVPAWAGRRADRQAAAAFAAVWAAIIAAAAIGNYPTPVVGYGGSAIVGYLLSLALLRPVPAGSGARRPAGAQSGGGGDERSLSAGLA